MGGEQIKVRMERRKKDRRKALTVAVGAFAILLCSFVVAYGLPEIKQKSKDDHCSQFGSQKSMGRWIYIGSSGGKQLQENGKAYLDEAVEQWTDGKVTDEELTDRIVEYTKQQEISIETMGVMSHQVCLFANENEIPDYQERMNNTNGIYEFVGLYTRDEISEDGKLICYYWEAGIR